METSNGVVASTYAIFPLSRYVHQDRLARLRMYIQLSERHKQSSAKHHLVFWPLLPPTPLSYTALFLLLNSSLEPDTSSDANRRRPSPIDWPRLSLSGPLCTRRRKGPIVLRLRWELSVRPALVSVLDSLPSLIMPFVSAMITPGTVTQVNVNPTAESLAGCSASSFPSSLARF